MRVRMKRLASWYQGMPRQRRIRLVALLLTVVVGGSYWGLREVAIRVGDHMRVTVTRINADAGGPAGSLIYTGTFGSALATEAERLLNDAAWVGFNNEGGNLNTPPAWHYHLAFTWRGMLVETVDVDRFGTPLNYSISALGVVAPWETIAYQDIIQQLAQDSGGAIPLSPRAS